MMQLLLRVGRKCQTHMGHLCLVILYSREMKDALF